MRFFFDENTPLKLVKAIRELDKDNEVIHCREKWGASTPDKDWMKALGNDGDWIVISNDLNISKQNLEYEAWKESGLTIYFLRKGWNSFHLWEKAWRFVKVWPELIYHGKQNRKKGAQSYQINLHGSKIE